MCEATISIAGPRNVYNQEKTNSMIKTFFQCCWKAFHNSRVKLYKDGPYFKKLKIVRSQQ